MIPESELPKAWAEALQRAGDALPGEDPRSHVFLEFRDDVRVRIDADGTREIAPTRACGAVARVAGEAAYLSNPEPGDLIHLVRATGASVVPASSRRARSADAAGVADDGALPGIVEGIADRARRVAGPGARVSVSSSSFDQRVSIALPGGRVVTDRRAGQRVRLEIRLQRSGRRATAVGERVMRDAPVDSAEGLEISVARRAEERLEATRAEEGDTVAVFSSGSGGVLIHEIVGHALEDDGPAEPASLLASQGGAVAPPNVSVIDDPLRGRGAWRIDDEGNEARAIELLREGRVVGRLADQGSRVSTTGHGRRASFRDPVRPRMGCTFLAPGSFRAEEVVASTERGIFVRRIEAVANDPRTGIALFRVSDGDRIVRGRLVGALAPFLLQVSALDALASLDAIANDLAFDTCIGTCLRDGQPLAVSVGAPTFRIGVVRVYG